MPATVRSTTGTAPLVFDVIVPNQVFIVSESVAQQVYRLSDLTAALGIGSAAAWSSGYWRGTSCEGPLTDAIVEAENPYAS